MRTAPDPEEGERSNEEGGKGRSIKRKKVKNNWPGKQKGLKV